MHNTTPSASPQSLLSTLWQAALAKWRSLGLQTRIMMHVTLGSMLVLLFFAYSAYRVLQNGTAVIYAERLLLSELTGREIAHWLTATSATGLKIKDPEAVMAVLKSHSAPTATGVYRYRVQVVDQAGDLVASPNFIPPNQVEEHKRLLQPYLAPHRSGVFLHEVASTGLSHLVAYSPLPDLPGGVLLEQDRDQALDLTLHWLRDMGLLAVVFLAGGLLLSWYTSRQVVRPLVRLTEVTRMIAAGNMVAPVPQDAQDELRTLATSFETMRHQLQESHDNLRLANHELEARVAERTAELLQRNQELASASQELQAREVERTYLLQRTIQAQEEERRIIAQELHDDVVQSLITVLRQLDDAEEAARQSTGVLDRLQGARTRLEQQIHAVRNFTRKLRPQALEDLGLVPALRRLLTDTSERTGIKWSLAVAGRERRLEEAVELGLYRIAQEAMHNVERHSGATEVRVQLDFLPGQVTLSITDNGHGFEVASARRELMERGSMGLRGMEERAALMHTQLQLDTAPGRGTAVRVDVQA